MLGLGWQWLIHKPVADSTIHQEKPAEKIIAATPNPTPVASSTTVELPKVQPPAPIAAPVLSDAVLSVAVGKAKYKIGEAFVLNLHVENSGYLRVANLSPAGEISEILPNPYQSSRVKASSDLQIPPKAKNIKLQVSAPVGRYKIVAVFSESPLPEVKNIIDHAGNVAAELLSTNIVSKVIPYEVVK
jgi:hypothetical protein